MIAREQAINYEDIQAGINFEENLDDGPDGYNVMLRGSHLYLPSRVLPELVRIETSTTGLVEKLTSINQGFPHMLKLSSLKPEQFHIAILKLALKRAEAERDYFAASQSE